MKIIINNNPSNNYKNSKIFFIKNNKQLTNFTVKKTYNLNGYIKLINFFQFLIKKNFYLFCTSNVINKKVFTFLHHLIFWTFRYEKFYNFIFFNYFLLNLSFFFVYKNPYILMNFFVILSKAFSFKTLRTLHSILFKLTYKLKKNFINNSIGLLGFMIKMKGKYNQRPGDRRKVYFYKFCKYSVSNPLNKYYIIHKQLKNNSGATGCTITVLFS